MSRYRSSRHGAATGFPKEFTTNGPQLLVVGDNPGGQEDVTVVPRNNPMPTVNRINRKYGMGNEGQVVNQTINLNISGNDIINQRNLSKRIKLELGDNRGRFL